MASPRSILTYHNCRKRDQWWWNNLSIWVLFHVNPSSIPGLSPHGLDLLEWHQKHFNQILSIFCIIPICWTFKTLQLFTIINRKEQEYLVINLIEFKSSIVGEMLSISWKVNEKTLRMHKGCKIFSWVIKPETNEWFRWWSFSPKFLFYVSFYHMLLVQVVLSHTLCCVHQGTTHGPRCPRTSNVVMKSTLPPNKKSGYKIICRGRKLSFFSHVFRIDLSWMKY